MNWGALRMLNGDTAKDLSAVFGVAFGVLLITQQASIFVGICETSAPFQSFPVVFATYSQATQFVARERKQLSFVVGAPVAGMTPAEACRRIKAATDRHDLPRFIRGAPALEYPSAERVDTRVLRVLFEIVDDADTGASSDGTPGRDLFVAQQLDVQIDAAAR